MMCVFVRLYFFNITSELVKNEIFVREYTEVKVEELPLCLSVFINPPQTSYFSAPDLFQ